MKSVVVFLVHQLIGTAGIGILVNLLAASMLEALRTIPSRYPESAWYWIFAFRPYYPVKILMGLYLGCLLARRLGHRAMVWIWVLPALLLIYAVVAVPTLTPDITSPLLWSGPNQSWLTHYFGWGCRMKDRCFDQVLTTQPFYSSTAYSVGGWLGIISRTSRPGGRGVP